MAAAGTGGSAGTKGFLFSDLRGYTAFVERAGDQAAADLLATYRALIREVIARHDGAEIRTEGDSVYVVFPNASAAVEAGLGIIAAATEQSTSERPVRVGVGVHAGETVATTEGLVGGAVNIAARVCSKAQPGELLVTDTVRALTRTFLPYGYTSLGTQQLKGIAGGIPLYRVEISSTTTRARLRRQLSARRGRVLVVVGLAVVLLAVGAGVYAANRAPDCLNLPASTKDVVAKIDPARNCVVQVVSVGRRPAPILFSGDSIWVGNTDDRTLTRISSDGRVLETIGTSGRITAVTSDDRSIWVLDGVGEIDAAKGGSASVKGTITSASVTQVDATAGTLLGVYAIPQLVDLIDPNIISDFPDLGPQSNGYLGIAAANGRVWLANGVLGEVIQMTQTARGQPLIEPRRIKVDPPPRARGTVPGFVGFDAAGTGELVPGENRLWIGHSGQPTIIALDTASSHLVTVSPQGAEGGETAMAADGADLWITFSGGQLARVDGLSLVGQAVDVGGDPRGVAVGPTGVWTAIGSTHEVVRIDPATMTASARIRVGGTPAGVAIAADGSVWVTIQGP